jgi:putative ABC transport system permease protein
MFKNDIKIAWRSLLKNRSSSIINIGGLAVGMAVALLIGFWIYDECIFDRQHENYDSIAEVMENQFINGQFGTQKQLPVPVAAALTAKFGNDFKRVVLSSLTREHILTSGERRLIKTGNFIEPQGPDLLLSGSLATALFGNTWIFAASGLGAIAITLLTVSFQSIKAALMNPARSLRSQ